MTDVALVEWAPLLELLALALLLAMGPLGWLYWRHRGRSPVVFMALLVGLTLFLTFDLVVFGAFTRLSDSGLGCPDWPGCYGTVSPWAAAEPITQAQAQLPTGPVTHTKAWIEMVHRYAAMVVGALIVVQVALSWRWRKHLKPGLFLPMFTLFWVCLQGAFGAWTVTMKLQPVIVTAHLLGGMTLLALLQWHRVQLTATWRASYEPAPYKRLAWLVFALLYVQMALGGWVSTNYAVLACQDFPMCQGQWWPPMDFASGFELWRPLGMDGKGQPIVFEALTAIHYTHRTFAWVVFGVLGFAGWRLWGHPHARTTGLLLWTLAGWQLLSGVSNVVLEWPLVAALAHTGGAAASVIVISGWLARCHLNKEKM